jgi:hypothetical protein
MLLLREMNKQQRRIVKEITRRDMWVQDNETLIFFLPLAPTLEHRADFSVS